MTRCFIAALVCGIVAASPAGAQEDGDEKGLDFMATPFAFYTTDTGFAAGAAMIKGYNKSFPRLSTAAVSLVYSEKKQFSGGISIDHYLNERLDRILTTVEYSKFPTEFYGIGNDTDNETSEQYTPEYTMLSVAYERSLVSALKLKLGWYIRSQALIKHETGGVFDTGTLRWNRGRLDAGPILGVLWDTRDNTYDTERGLFVKGEYHAILLQDDGGAFNGVSFEARAFRPLAGPARLASMVRFEDVRGDVPYYMFPSLGGYQYLRGYEDLRFRGRSMLLVQEDVRFPVWRFINGAVFAAGGRVGDTAGELFEGDYHWSYGLGPRFVFNEKDHLLLRCDIAWSEDSSGFYLTFSEAF